MQIDRVADRSEWDDATNGGRESGHFSVRMLRVVWEERTFVSKETSKVLHCTMWCSWWDDAVFGRKRFVCRRSKFESAQIVREAEMKASFCTYDTQTLSTSKAPNGAFL